MTRRDPVAHRRDPGLVVHAGEQPHLARLDEREHRARGAGPRGAPGAVQVVLRVVRRIEVHDQVDVVDVNPARGDVGGDQHPRVAGGKAGQRALALVLVEVAVDRSRRRTRAAELQRQPVSAVLGAHEEQAAGRTARDLSGDGHLVGRRA